MRFLYGVLLGVLVTVIAAILYIAFAGGDYLLLLSPKYHEMQSQVLSLQKAEEQRDQLAKRLESLELNFDSLTRRFNELQGAGREPRPGEAPGPAPSPGAGPVEGKPSAGSANPS